MEHHDVADLLIQKQLEKAKRIKKIKQKRRIRKLTTILIIAVLSLLYFFSDFSKLKNINIINNNLISDNEILELAKVDKNKAIILLNPFLMKKRIKKQPLIADTSIKYSLFKRELIIDISEKDVFAYKIDDNQATLLLFNNEKLDLVSDYYPYLANFIYLNGFDEEEIFERLLREFKKVDQDVFLQISEISQISKSYDQNYLEVKMNDGNKVYLSLAVVKQLNYYFDIIVHLKASNSCIVIDDLSQQAYSSECKNIINVIVN